MVKFYVSISLVFSYQVTFVVNLVAWITHISAVIICKLVDDAVKKKLDPRQDPETTITDGFSLSCEDVKKLWYYIGKEVSYVLCTTDRSPYIL